MLQPQDYNCIGIIAQHCDNEKLCVAEQEALEFDLSSLFCDFWYDILEYWQQVDAYDLAVANCNGNQECMDEITPVVNYAEKKALIYGGYFPNCSGNLRPFSGVKKILVYYSYARYIHINAVSDTSTGLVKKTSDFAIQLNQKELDQLADKYRTMGKITFDQTSGFLCNKRELFTSYNSNGCRGCGCSCEKCGGTTKAKGYGIRSSNINKRL